MEIYGYMTDTMENSEEGQTYKSLLSHARELLRDRSPEDVAEKAQVNFDRSKGEFTLKSLGRDISVSCPSWRVTFTGTDIRPQMWWVLSVLHYMATADAIPLSGDLITLGMLEDGRIRGGVFEAQCSKEIADFFGNKSISELEAAARELGAEILNSKADFCVRLPYLPLYPVTFQIWLADDEFPGSGQMLLDRRANHYLSTEDAVCACEMLLDFFRRLMD